MIIYSGKRKSGTLLTEWCLTLFINAIVILMASNIFKGFYIDSFGYAIITAFIIMFLNKTIKPLIQLLTLPITIFTLGIFYPFVNVIILKIASWLMGKMFVVEGWIVPFFISIFISIMTIALDALITKQILRGEK